MTKREAAIIELYTGICMLTGDDRKYVYAYARELMGRPILTHELSDEMLKEKSKADFIKLCKNLKSVEDSACWESCDLNMVLLKAFPTAAFAAQNADVVSRKNIGGGSIAQTVEQE